MKALVYHGAKNVSIEKVPDAKIEKPTDVVVKITTTNICGSDLHMYEGRTSVEKGKILGHENLGQVVEVGNGVETVKKGDYVCLPFNIGCGFCKNCERGLTGFCLTANPGSAGAAYGFADMGPYSGGQAEYLRVPFADFNCLQLPPDVEEKENDYVMLSDIFPTGWHATELAGVKPGDSIVIYGAGPVGLMAALSSHDQRGSEGNGSGFPPRPVEAGGAVGRDCDRRIEGRPDEAGIGADRRRRSRLRLRSCGVPVPRSSWP